jgi:hypothetical protein
VTNAPNNRTAGIDPYSDAEGRFIPTHQIGFEKFEKTQPRDYGAAEAAPVGMTKEVIESSPIT